MSYIPFDDFEKEKLFPQKSSRVPCKEPSPNVNPFPSFDLNANLMGQVSGWIRPDTGNFPSVTPNSSTSVSVPAGKGYIVDPNLGIKEVSWIPNNLVLTNIADTWVTTIAVNSLGEIVQFPGEIQSSRARTHIILCTVTHINGYIDTIQMTPSIWGGISYAAYDLAMASRNTVFEGGLLTPNLANKLSLNISARKVFFYGAAMNELHNSNTVDEEEQIRIMFFLLTGGAHVGDSVPNIPVNMFNPGGSNIVQVIPGSDNTSTAFRLYQLGGKYILLYGQTTYVSLQECVSNFSRENVVYPEKLKSGKLLAVICVRKGATDLSNPNDAIITISNQSASTASSGSGSSVGVSPRIWSWEGDGESTDFPIPGADIADPLLYDSAMEASVNSNEYTVSKPGVDFIILLGDTVQDTFIRFLDPITNSPFVVPDGIKGFTILRGYSLPVIGTPPVQSLRIPIIDVSTTNYLVTKEAEFSLIRTLSSSETTITIRDQSNDSFDIENGSYFSVCQRGSGQAKIAISPAGTLIVPTGYLPYTRGEGSTISAVCEYADGNIWLISGDLAEEP